MGINKKPGWNIQAWGDYHAKLGYVLQARLERKGFPLCLSLAANAHRAGSKLDVLGNFALLFSLNVSVVFSFPMGKMQECQ